MAELVVPLVLGAVLAEVAAAAVFAAEAALEALRRLERAEAWLLEMLLIDIMPRLAVTSESGVSAWGRRT